MSLNHLNPRCSNISDYLSWAEDILDQETTGASGDDPLDLTSSCDLCSCEPDPINVHEMRVVAKYDVSFCNNSILPHWLCSVAALPSEDRKAPCLSPARTSSDTTTKTSTTIFGSSSYRFLQPTSTQNSTQGEADCASQANGDIIMHPRPLHPIETSNIFDEEIKSHVDDRNGGDGVQTVSRMPRTQSETWSEDSNHCEEVCDDRWEGQFAQLEQFVWRYGHARVPVRCRFNLPLSKWAKRQRYQYKLKQEGKHSTLSDRREQKLSSLGFEWDLRFNVWEQRFEELLEFKRQHGHMSVPVTCPEFPKLGSWVKCARRQGRLFSRGQPSTMTCERAEKLAAIGFTWEAKRPRQEESCTQK